MDVDDIPDVSDSDDLFIPGVGYWVHSKVDTVWDVPL
jgi:hypothetical protein